MDVDFDQSFDKLSKNINVELHTSPPSYIMGRSTFIQWNYRGFKVNTDEVDLLIQSFIPLVLCLLETYLKDVNISCVRKYSFYNKIGSVIENKASGGVTIMVNITSQ